MSVRSLVILLALAGAAHAKPAYLVSYGAYGSPEGIVARGRAHKGTPPPDALARPKVDKVLGTVKAFTGRDVEHPLVLVTDVASGRTAEARGDDDGFYEVRLPGPFPAGPRRVTVVLRDAKYAADPVDETAVVVAQGLVLVSDIDDTIVETGVTKGKAALIARVLSSDAGDVKPLPGAAGTLGAFAAAGIPVIYVSASPVELASRLKQVLALRGFPAGPLFLRHYEEDGIGDPSAYKRRVFAKLAADLPRARFLLLGDNGEKDPAIFAALARDTGRVAHRFIRITVAGAPADGAFAFGSFDELRAFARKEKLIP